MKLRAIALAALTTLAVAPAAYAQNSNNGATSLTLFDEGLKLMDQKKYVEAVDRFTRSNELEKSVGNYGNLTECYEKLGKTASAWTAANDGANLAHVKKDFGREKILRKRARDFEPKLAKIKLVSSQTPDLTVRENGEKVDSAALNTATPVDAGQYKIEASAPGRKPWSTNVDVKDGGSIDVPIPDLEPDPAAPGPVALPPAPPAEPGSNSSPQRTVGIGLEIGGGVVLGAGLVFGALAIGSWGSVNNKCGDGHCPDPATKTQEQSKRDSAATFATISTIGTIVGAAALAGGIVLHLTAKKHEVAISPAVDRTTAGLSLTFQN